MNTPNAPFVESTTSTPLQLKSVLLEVLHEHIDAALSKPMTNFGDTVLRQYVAADPRLAPIRDALRGTGLFDEEGVESAVHSVVLVHFIKTLYARAELLGREDHLPPWTQGYASVCQPYDEERAAP